MNKLFKEWVQKMVPSDLRTIISERDCLREEKAELLNALQNLDDYYSSPGEDDWVRFYKEVLEPARAAIAKAQKAQYKKDKEAHSHPWMWWEYRLPGDPRWFQCVNAPLFGGVVFYRRKGETE